MNMNRPFHLTFAAHVALEFLLGVAVAVAPFPFDFDDGATIVSLALGVAIATVAISTQVTGGSITTHEMWDRGMFILLCVAAIVSAIADIGADTAVWAVAAAIEAALLSFTRYVSERP
jgi:hypothetical protein